MAEVKPELAPKKKVFKEEQAVAQTPVVAPLESSKAEVSKETKTVQAQPDMEELYTQFASRMKAELATQPKEGKKPKKKVVIVEEDSSSEEEVIVRRKKAPAEVVKEVLSAPPAVKSTGSRVLDKLLFSKF